MKLAPPPYAVEVLPPTSDIPAGVYFSLETPLPGAKAESLVIEIAGWVAHTERCDLPAPLEVAILVDGEEWLAAPVNQLRHDVGLDILANSGETVTSDLNGFSFLLPVYLSLRPAAVYELVALVGPTRHQGYVIGTISFGSARGLGDNWSPPRRMTPVLITSLGRSGSSVLCRMLSEHPLIYSARSENQFGELQVLGFIARLMSVVSSEGSIADLNELENRPDFYSLPAPVFASRKIGGVDHANSCEQGLLPYMNTQILKFAQGFLDDYFTRIRSLNSDAKYLVEKNWNAMSANSLRVLVDDLKEIFLVRSLRDFWNSQFGFLNKEKIDEERVRIRIAKSSEKFQAMARSWRDRRGHALLVRYEDLMADPEQTLLRIFQYLGCEMDPAFSARVGTMLGDRSAHSRMLMTNSHGAFDAEFDAYLASLHGSIRDDLVRASLDLGYEI